MDALFTPLWIVWLLLFGVIEGLAIWRKKKGDTLSEQTWSWFCLRGDKSEQGPSCAWRRIAFIAFWGWLTIHFITGGSWL